MKCVNNKGDDITLHEEEDYTKLHFCVDQIIHHLYAVPRNSICNEQEA